MAMLCLSLVMMILLVAVVNPRLKAVARTCVQGAVERMCYSQINSAADMALEQSAITYSDIVKIERGADNAVTAVMTDIAVVNKIKTETNAALLDAISGMDGEEVPVSLGTLTGNAMLSGRGPDINVRVRLTGSAEVEIRSNFESVGINQTRHVITMEIVCRVYIVMLGAQSVQEILLSVPIAETIIVGTVPNALLSSYNNSAND